LRRWSNRRRLRGIIRARMIDIDKAIADVRLCARKQTLMNTHWCYAHCIRLLALLCWIAVAVAAEDKKPAFDTIAEGFSSGPQEQGIRAGHRMFSRPALLERCAQTATPARLESDRPVVKLHVGKWFVLDGLSVIAKDAGGNRLPPVPLMIEVDEGARGVLNLELDMVQSDRVLPIKRGSFRFMVRTICPGPEVETYIQATVVRP